MRLACFSGPILSLACVALLTSGCTKDSRSEYDSGDSGGGIGEDGSGSGNDGESNGTSGNDDSMDSIGSDDGNGEKFDVAQAEGGDGDGDGDCTVPTHTPCDSGNATYGQAMGLGCPGELPFVPVFSGGNGSIGLRSSFGPTNEFNPREGLKYVVISNGLVADLDTPNTSTSPTSCNTSLGAYPTGGTLPAPLVPVNVGAQDCTQNPSLIGTGDCSNTIQDQFDQGGGVSGSDYTELRLENITVPGGATSFSYDLAFFSTEYPVYYQTVYNDMYVGWLESMQWTGNISFDEQGNPISLNAGFLNYTDGAPELANTCVNFNAGTKWLTSTASVVPEETITLVFAVFDLSDSVLDTFVFLDNFQWGCEGGPPSTTPAG
ncbi:MAG: choice-of-anchor L domain-containing protein [Nannocystaceae bacterium]